MPISKTNVSRNLAWSYINWVASFAAPLILIPLYVRLLGARVYGEWIIITSVVSYLGLANLGSLQALSNQITEAIAHGARDRVGRLISTTFITYGMIAAGLMLAVFALTPLLASRIAPGADSRALVAFFIFIVLAAVAFPMRAHVVALRAFERVDLEQRIQSCSTTLRVAATAAALLAGFKLFAVAIIQGGSMVGAAVAAYVQALKLDRDAKPRVSSWSLPLFSGLVRPSVAFLGLALASTLAFGVDNLVIGYAIGARAVTQFAIPFRLTTIVTGAFAAGLAALWPTITKFHAHDRLDIIRGGYILLMRLAILFGSGAAIALWILGPGFIRIWAGAGVFPGQVTYRLQLVLMLIQVMLIPADAVLMATTRHYGYALLAVTEGVLNLALSLLWVRRWGLPGVIGATIVARMITNGWYMPFASMRTIAMPFKETLRALAPALMVAAVAISIAAIVAGSVNGLAFWRGVLITAGLLFALVVTYGSLAFTSDERRAGYFWIAAHTRTLRAA